MSRYNNKIHGNPSDEYGTPARFLQPIAQTVGGFDLDPCSGAETLPHARKTYTIEDDGLSKPWFGKVWCNPPFSVKEDWLKKAWSEHHDGNTELILMLLPVDTSPGWFHRYVVKGDFLWFKKGRLSFDGGSDWDSSFGLMMVVYGDPPRELLKHLEKGGEVFQQGNRFKTSEQIALNSVT